jgi:peptidoglycan/xylan/chitin deacetylase (PgdA/CDA1 family)
VAERQRLCAISVDLDEIRHYYAIHAQSVVDPLVAHAVYDRALARFRDLAADNDVPLTLFVVASDLVRDENRAILRGWSAAGHELGNHTLDHHYDLSRRPIAEIHEQIERANELIFSATGQRPVGFRAPGYVMSDAVYRALSDVGMAYSSSVFPCPVYYAAKLAVMLGLRLSGRRSSSIVSGPGVLAAPRAPYRVGKPYHRIGAGLLELPIAVTPGLRLPFIGTNLTLLGPSGALGLAKRLLGQELINLELHGVDLLDVHDGLHELGRHQPDLRVPLQRKWAVFTQLIAMLRANGYSFVRLDEAARRLAPA